MLLPIWDNRFVCLAKHKMNKKRCGHDTLTTLKLVKKYNPSFVTTFLVDRKEAHCLTGDDLRRCENIITLKKKKEINAKYSGLLKSKIKTASLYKNKSNGKASARVEKPRAPRQGSAKSQRSQKSHKAEKSKDVKQEHLSTVSKTKKLDMKEIFKSSVFTNFSASTVGSSAKCPNDLLPTPKDIIERTGSKVKSFWNLSKSPRTLTKAERIKRLEFNRDENSLHHETNACGDHITVTLKSKTENIHSGKAQINTLKISRRSCFSLLNVNGTNDCKVLYKNCFLCNQTKDLRVFSNKLNSPKCRYVVAAKPNNVAEKRTPIELRSSSIGFATSELTIHRIEVATVELIPEVTFTIHETYVQKESKNFIRCTIGRFCNYLMALEEESIEKSNDQMLASKSSYRLASAIFGIILSSYIIYLMCIKFASVFVIK